MGTVVDLTGQPLCEPDPTLAYGDNPHFKPNPHTINEDAAHIIDHIADLCAQGRVKGLMVAVIQPDGTKTKAYAMTNDTDPTTMLGTLDLLRDMILRDIHIKPD